MLAASLSEQTVLRVMSVHQYFQRRWKHRCCLRHSVIYLSDAD